MTNQDIAFVTVCGMCVIAIIYLCLAWKELDEYRRRAVRAELEVRRLTAPVPADAVAVIIPPGFQIWHSTYNHSLSDAVNEETRWVVERLVRPFTGASGTTRWFGSTLGEAMHKALTDLPDLKHDNPVPDVYERAFAFYVRNRAVLNGAPGELQHDNV